MRIMMGLAGAALLALPVSGAGQQADERFRPPSGGYQPEAIIYRDANYSGPAVAIQREESNLGLAWQVRSIRIQRGQWQVCTGRNFTGKCSTVTRSEPNVASQMRRIVSMRPLGWGGGGGPGYPPPRPQPNQSLRGMAAEFFPAPTTNGYRVRACVRGSATASCAARSADAYCRTAGWNGSKSEAIETVGRENYLADVLCARSGY